MFVVCIVFAQAHFAHSYPGCFEKYHHSSCHFSNKRHRTKATSEQYRNVLVPHEIYNEINFHNKYYGISFVQMRTMLISLLFLGTHTHSDSPLLFVFAFRLIPACFIIRATHEHICEFCKSRNLLRTHTIYH